MKEIPLTKGYVALVDDDDYAYLSKFKWYWSTGYAVRDVWYPERKYKAKILMHREILRFPKQYLIDHINMNGTDNRKENLRLASKAENQRHQKVRSHNKTGYKGVSVDYRRKEGSKRYRSRINVDGVKYELGLFRTPEEAAVAYNEAAKKYHGEFAHLNVIKETR